MANDATGKPDIERAMGKSDEWKKRRDAERERTVKTATQKTKSVIPDLKMMKPGDPISRLKEFERSTIFGRLDREGNRVGGLEEDDPLREELAREFPDYWEADGAWTSVLNAYKSVRMENSLLRGSGAERVRILGVIGNAMAEYIKRQPTDAMAYRALRDIKRAGGPLLEDVDYVDGKVVFGPDADVLSASMALAEVCTSQQAMLDQYTAELEEIEAAKEVHKKNRKLASIDESELSTIRKRIEPGEESNIDVADISKIVSRIRSREQRREFELARRRDEIKNAIEASVKFAIENHFTGEDELNTAVSGIMGNDLIGHTIDKYARSVYDFDCINGQIEAFRSVEPTLHDIETETILSDILKRLKDAKSGRAKDLSRYMGAIANEVNTMIDTLGIADTESKVNVRKMFSASGGDYTKVMGILINKLGNTMKAARGYLLGSGLNPQAMQELIDSEALYKEHAEMMGGEIGRLGREGGARYDAVETFHCLNPEMEKMFIEFHKKYRVDGEKPAYFRPRPSAERRPGQEDSSFLDVASERIIWSHNFGLLIKAIMNNPVFNRSEELDNDGAFEYLLDRFNRMYQGIINVRFDKIEELGDYIRRDMRIWQDIMGAYDAADRELHGYMGETGLK